MTSASYSQAAVSHGWSRNVVVHHIELRMAKVDIKPKLAARRAERAKRAAVAQPPRYDDMVFEGLSCLDELGSLGFGRPGTAAAGG